MRKCVAELFGTYVLVFTGTGAVVMNDASHGTVTHIGIALTFGLIVLALIYSIGEVSGCHINPAVTIGLYSAGHFSAGQILPYICSQVIGAILASLTLRVMFPEHPTLGATIPVGSAWQSFVLEFILTFLLMYVVLSFSNASKEKAALAGIVIGAVIALEALFAGPISGASMNPARSLAPALVSLRMDSLWIYLTATVLGACASVPLWRFTHGTDDTSKSSML